MAWLFIICPIWNDRTSSSQLSDRCPPKFQSQNPPYTIRTLCAKNERNLIRSKQVGRLLFLRPVWNNQTSSSQLPDWCPPWFQSQNPPYSIRTLCAKNQSNLIRTTQVARLRFLRPVWNNRTSGSQLSDWCPPRFQSQNPPYTIRIFCAKNERNLIRT